MTIDKSTEDRFVALATEIRDMKCLLQRVLNSVAIPPNDEIYVSRPETVRDVLLDEIGQECERLLGAAGKPCFERWEAAGYEVEWTDGLHTNRSGDPAYEVRFIGACGLGETLVCLDSVETVDAWIGEHPVQGGSRP